MRYDYEDHPLSLGSKTFANNLALLLRVDKVSKAYLCNRAGISRSQLARMLDGTSFPKPHVLVEICNLFSVDARVLTQRLLSKRPSREVARHYQDIWNSLLDFGAFSEAQSASKYIPPDQNDVEDGLYKAWFPDAMELGTYYCAIAQVSTESGVRLLESRELLSDWGSMPRNGQLSSRHRGICYKQVNGFCTLQFIGNSHMRFFLSFERLNRFRTDCYGGIALWTSDGLETPFSLQPVVMEMIPKRFGDAVRAARASGTCSLEEIPDFVRVHFDRVRTEGGRFFNIL